MEQTTLIWVARLVFCLIATLICYGVWCFMRREREVELPSLKPYTPTKHTDLPEKNIVLNVMSKPGRIFDNAQLFEVMRRLGFHYGDNHVFEYYVPDSKYIAFSVINVRPPYIFSEDPHQMPPTNGLVAVMQLPVADGDDQVKHFHLLLHVIDQVITELNAELCDAQRRHLIKDAHLFEIQKEIDVFEQAYLSSLQHAYQNRS